MSQQYPDIDRLIGLYLSGRLSSSERSELEQWLKSSSANQKVFERLKEIWPMPSSDQYDCRMDLVKERIWAAGAYRQDKHNSSGNRGDLELWKWGKIAAMLFFFITGFWLYFFSEEEKYSSKQPIAMVEKFNPAGQKSHHRLPDGTLVWLNAESKLVYPEKFSDTLRQVLLIGEAYFEVAQVKQKPFLVEASGTVTHALGTAFNIQSYPENPIIKIALLEGKIEVRNKQVGEPIILAPGQELQALKEEAAYSMQQFKFENTFGWKNGILVFDGADFSSFRSTIEKWYGVKVEVKGTAPDDWSLRARYQGEVLQHVIQDISFNKNLKYEIKDKSVLLIF